MPIPGHSIYPDDLAAEARMRWLAGGYPAEYLPGPSQLVEVLDISYQASLLREEGDPVRCRVILCSPGDFEKFGDPGTAELSVLQFEEVCDFTPHEVRKLSAAAGYYRSMLAVQLDDYGHACIWGIILTGTRWFNHIEGGRYDGVPLPPNLVVHVTGPGRLTVASGYTRVLETAGGQLLTEGFDPFLARWLPARFQQTRLTIQDELAVMARASCALPSDSASTLAASTAAARRAAENCQVCDKFITQVAQSVFRRTLGLVRGRRHGGMLVHLPLDVAESKTLEDWFRFRVKFTDNSAALRMRMLMNQLLHRVRVLGARAGLELVTWEDYKKMQDTELTDLDEALIEFAHFLSDLMSADGCVVIDRSFRMIGCGGEILGETPVSYIHRALDLEAYQTIREPAFESGTRHRSAYRLVSGLPETIAVVVSQDGAIRFVAYHNDKLTYWPYLP